MEAVKRENQTEVQHPVFSPLFEQWEEFIQHLTKQAVRQATVKTADDRLAVIWPEKVGGGDCSEEILEETVTNLLRRYGVPIDKVSQPLIQPLPKESGNELFGY